MKCSLVPRPTSFSGRKICVLQVTKYWTKAGEEPGNEANDFVGEPYLSENAVAFSI